MANLFGPLDLPPDMADILPDQAEIVRYATRPGAPSPVKQLRTAAGTGRPVVQPRCGVGGHAEMLDVLRGLERAGADILSVTIDSYTRLKLFDSAARVLRERPEDLNGYPLVAHGWRRGRKLTEAVRMPLEVRHGSPDPRELFAVCIASGMLSFEGGAIGYTLPYSKEVPLWESWEAWRRVDAVCGLLNSVGVLVDRELFGSLTGVLVPPSVSLASTLLEACSAVREGVRCISIAYPQGGQAHQDIAALRAIRVLTARYLGDTVEVYPVLHEFMGVFPRMKSTADALILYGGLIARLGGAAKVVSKTNREAYNIPDAETNADGIRTTVLGCTELFDFVEVDTARVEEEQYWIQREVTELVDPVLAGDDLAADVVRAFRDGTLDVPFSPSKYTRSQIIPRRDRHGAIRYADSGSLPFSAETLRHNDECLRSGAPRRSRSLVEIISADLEYFAGKDAADHTAHR